MCMCAFKLCASVYVCTCWKYVCVCVRVHVCVSVCVCVRVCVRACARVCILTRVRSSALSILTYNLTMLHDVVLNYNWTMLHDVHSRATNRCVSGHTSVLMSTHKRTYAHYLYTYIYVCVHVLLCAHSQIFV